VPYATSHDGAQQNESAPNSFESWDAKVEQPSPEVCSKPLYLLTRNVGMAPACHCAARLGYPSGSSEYQVQIIHFNFNAIPKTRSLSLGVLGGAAEPKQRWDRESEPVNRLAVDALRPFHSFTHFFD
jgi:hypothetical protein